MEDPVTIVFFGLAFICIIFFYVLVCKRIEELEEQIAKRMELQVEFNQDQHALNVEASKKFKEITDRIDILEKDLKQSIEDRIDLSSKVGDLNSKVYNLSFQTPNQRVDALAKSFKELMDEVEKYEEILLDHAMGS